MCAGRVSWVNSFGTVKRSRTTAAHRRFAQEPETQFMRFRLDALGQAVSIVIIVGLKDIQPSVFAERLVRVGAPLPCERSERSRDRGRGLGNALTLALAKWLI